MPGGFAPRFAIEAGFLILLGVGAGIADLRPSVIVALLAGGWVLVSLIELSVWRAEARTAVPPMPPTPTEPPEPEPEAELEVGWPLEEDDVAAADAYPLRSDAEASGAEAEEYTRVPGSAERASRDDTAE
jgi:hypothetical protein